MVAGASTKDILINELRTESEQIQKRLRELGSLVDQSQAEVRKLQQRSIEINSQMKRIEDNFDTVPRNDIRVVYTSALDTRARLLTSQSQLEKFQQDRAQLERFGSMINNLLSMLEGVAVPNVPIAASGDSDTGGLSNDVIVRIVQSQEMERQRLARQMHDGPAQSLTNFILQAEICRRLFDRNPDRAGEELDNLKTAATTTFQRVRDFIFELRPMMLDDLGLAPTVRRYMEMLRDKNGIETRFNILGEERRRFEPHIEVMMFRGLQEILGYARDNAGASKIEIVLDVSGSPLKAMVSFNGRSIPEIEGAAEQGKSRAYSLSSLIERLGLIGGTVDYQSPEGEPNYVEIALPTGGSE